MRIVIEGHDLPGAEFVSNANRCATCTSLSRSARSPSAWSAATLSARWEIDVRAIVADGGVVDPPGPAVHGKKGERFVYLTWGDVGRGDSFAMFRRAKLMIADIDPEMLAGVARDDGVLVASLSLTDERGCPRCARVKPPVVRWRPG